MRQHSSRRGSLPLLLVGALAVVVTLAGVMWLWTGNTSQDDQSIVLHQIERGDFQLTITERGEIEAAGVIEVRSEVKTKNTPGLAILRVVAEGTKVKAGDFLVELDSSALEAERITQQNLESMAEALTVETRNLYETALIAKEEYVDGTYVQERQTFEGEAFVAEENLNRAKEYYLFSQKLAAKGHVNELQLEADRFAIEKSEKELEAARTKLRVLDEYTQKKMTKQLQSDIAITEAKWGSAKRSYELEKAALQELEDQIAKCMIYSPKDSVVIYANDRDRHGNDEWMVEEGSVVRERQVIFRLPDSDAMQVELKINETLVQYIRAEMPATIIPIGVNGVELQGVVTRINDYAEPGNWRKADVKEYKAFVSINGSPADLRSGMTVSVTVQCNFVADAIQAPVQAVHPHGGNYYCIVRREGKFVAQEVECGATNSEFFVIEKGLNAGDQVAMNPRRYLDKVTLPELPATPSKGPGDSPRSENVAKRPAQQAKPQQNGSQKSRNT